MGKTFSGKNKNKGYQIKKKDIEKQKQEEQARKARKSRKVDQTEKKPTKGIEEYERLIREKSGKAAQIEDDEKEL